MAAEPALPARVVPVYPTAARAPALSPRTIGAAVGLDEQARLQASLSAARAGNTIAFEAVYRALAPRLSRYARGLVGQDAEDVAAEAWLQIVRDLGRFDGDWDAFRGWAARILRNRAIDHLRAASRRPVHATTADALAERASADDTP